jgi:tol-pal system protein YbgF
MARHPILRCARFGLYLGLLLLVVTMPAVGQDRSTQERLDRLERDLNMLQRQVYRGAPAPMGGDPSAAVGMELRLNRLEEQMRDLTGRVEEYTNQIEQLHARIEQVNNDMAARGNEGGPGAGPMAAAPPPGRSLPPPAMRSGPGPQADISDFPPPPPGSGRGPGMPEPIFNTLTPPGTPAPPPPGPPANVASAGGGLPSAAARAPAGGSPTDQYNHAFGLLKQADYPRAEVEFRAFLDQHPNDSMAGAAQYWLGDTYYARGRYADAARAFAEVYKRYPKSVKAPEALLKLGMSLGQANQKQNACVALAQLDQAFPHAAGNVKQQSAAEKRRLGCS